jgi:hypothetical protein
MAGSRLYASLPGSKSPRRDATCASWCEAPATVPASGRAPSFDTRAAPPYLDPLAA